MPAEGTNCLVAEFVQGFYERSSSEMEETHEKSVTLHPQHIYLMESQPQDF